MQTSRQTEFKITPAVKKNIIKIVDERIKESHVTREDFSELKGIVRELGIKVGELAEAQKRTEEEIRKLAIGLNNLRGEVGGLARSFGYAFENEAYRMLPKALKEKYGIELTEKLIRIEIGDTEINIVGFGRRDGTEIVVIGEVKTRLERMEVFDELEDKVKVVREEYTGKEIVKVLVTHFATKRILKVAEDSGVIVVQSFEW